jgi:AcrR family transcriptional regulator
MIIADTLSTKEALLKSARRLFAKQGYDATSIKEIVDDAGVNISLVSYHFGGKEGLYKACISELALQRLSVAQEMLKPPKSVEEFKIRLQMYTLEMLKFYVSEPDIAAIIHRELDMNRPFMKELFDTAILKKFMLFLEFLEGAKSEGILKPELDALTFSGMYFSYLIQLQRTDHIGEAYFNRTIKDSGYQEQVAKQIESIFLYGILNEGEQG